MDSQMVEASEPRKRAGVRVMVIGAITGVGMMLGVGVTSAAVSVTCTDPVDLAQTSPCAPSGDPVVPGPDGGVITPDGTRIG